VIAKDSEIEKIQRQITSGVTGNGQNLTNYLTTWDNYCEIWEINKDAFIRRYQKLNPQVSSFDADIARSVSFSWLYLTIECYKCMRTTVMKSLRGQYKIEVLGEKARERKCQKPADSRQLKKKKENLASILQ